VRAVVAMIITTNIMRMLMTNVACARGQSMQNLRNFAEARFFQMSSEFLPVERKSKAKQKRRLVFEPAAATVLRVLPP
jgi:hypothetical protein